MTIVYGFELLNDDTIAEYKTAARLWRHVQTGAELLSLENEDENKVFGITFRTPPSDSTGLSHIMEHAVLTGSRKYPVKEPFIELSKGSLKTFLNAFTFPDKTCYPVASQNVKDFYNLIDVYLDAVFFPLIPPHILQQEGWHFELENLDDPLSFKGVVFNEMKGAYSSPDSLLYRYSQQSLFPDNTYGVDSGGDPEQIPNLTYEQFRAFHDTYYHPANSRIYFYGDDEPQKRLQLVNEYLVEFQAVRVQSNISLQPRFVEPRKSTYPYDAGQEAGNDNKGMVSINWMLTEAGDHDQTLALGILSYILIGTPASPLRKALIDSGLGDDLTSSGLENDLRQMIFSTGLKGIAADDAEKVEALILDTLVDLTENGIEPDTIEAALNTSEFRLRENNTGSFPRGLSLMLRSLTTWLHDGDPLAPLRFEASLNTIKAHLAANEPFFEDLIRRHLLQNPHRTTILLKPDPDLRQSQEAKETERLAETQAAMTEEELQAVIDSTHRLKLIQETPDSPEALATIPTLTHDDLDRQNKTIPLEVLKNNGNEILYHDLFTSDILYLDVGFNMRALSQELLPYVPLFGQSLVKIGTEREDFVKLSQRIGRKTGGISPSTMMSASRETPEAVAWLFLHAKATIAQADDLLAILKDILLTVRLDNQERFKQMVLETKARMESGLIPGGHSVVNSRLRARFDKAGWAAEQIGGVSYLLFLRQLAQDVDENWPGVLGKLEQVRRNLISQNNTICNVTVDRANWADIQHKLTDFLRTLPSDTPNRNRWSPGHFADHEGLTVPAQVNYVGKGANLYKLGYHFNGSIAVITNYLRSTWLWERVRVHGGAYGAFCVFDHHSGVFTFLSYRDPNLLDTLEVFDQSSEFLRQLDLSETELLKTIIGAIGRMDGYQLPDAKGYTSMVRYLTGDTETLRQQRRDEVLGATAADFEAFADVLERLNQDSPVVILGSDEAIAAASEAKNDWLNVQKVL